MCFEYCKVCVASLVGLMELAMAEYKLFLFSNTALSFLALMLSGLELEKRSARAGVPVRPSIMSV